MRSLLSHFKRRFPSKLLALFIFLFAAFAATPVHAEQWQKLNPQGYVNDFAGVLDATTVEGLTRLSTEVDQKAKAQITVVTVKDSGR